MIKVAPSLLAANFANLEKEIKSVETNGADWLHYDVMDGHFVNNISFGYSILNDVSKVTDLFLDVHLMISDPARYVDEFIASHADLITFHLEAMENEEKTFELIHHIKDQGAKVGLSIKPSTPVEALDKYLDDLDLILVMSVEPGFGGQSFKASALDKINYLNQLKKQHHFLIEVDGGVDESTGKQCIRQGADVLVAGSYIFNSNDKKQAIASLK